VKFRQRAREPDVELNLTPLIDVVFLLLIFFMVSSTFKQESELLLSLPEASDEPVEVSEVEVVEVAIDAKGVHYVNEHQITDESLNTLKNAMQMAAGEQSSPKVVIRADRQAPHGEVVQALEAARLLGFSEVTFATTLGDGDHVE